MSKTTTVTMTDFDPDLLVVKEPRNMNAKNGTAFRRADITYKGQPLILDIPKTGTSGIFWTVPKENDKGEIQGYPKPMIVKEIDPDNAEHKKITDFYDKVYCAIFKKLAVYGKSFKKPTMLRDATKYAKPEMLDQMVQLDPDEPEKILVREYLRSFMNNFYEHPLIAAEGGGIGEPDITKKKRFMLELRKQVSTTKETGGLDKYDCEFHEVKLGDEEPNTKEPPMLWSELTGELVLKFRNAITHIYIGSGNPSIQDKLVSGTIYKRTVSGMAGGYVPSATENNDKDDLTEEEREYIKARRLKRLQEQNEPKTEVKPNTAVVMPPAKGTETVAVDKPKEVKETKLEKKKETAPVDTTETTGGLNPDMLKMLMENAGGGLDLAELTKLLGK